MSDGSSFYITTPIFYVNDVPHIGHAYTEVAADVLARWHRQAGDDTWLLTGTDEHGQKILRTATANGTTPKEWADRLVHDEWLPLLKTIDIANDDFIRTTDERHEKNVQLFLQKLYDDGFIYAGRVRGPLLRRLRGVQAAERDRGRHRRVRRAEGVRHPLEAARTAAGEELLLPHERLLPEASRPLRVPARLRAARGGAQRGGLVRSPGPVRPVDLAVELRLGHQGAVGRVARRLRLVRRAPQLRHGRRLRPGRRRSSNGAGRRRTSSAKTSCASTRSSGRRC